MAAPDFLSRVLAVKEREQAALRDREDPDLLRQRALQMPPTRDFVGALRNCPHVPVIAEIKRRSPSLGDIRPGVNPASQARAYQAGGAAACSVLTDGRFFGGSMADLAEARRAVDLPLLCKDFIVAEAQLYSARSAGADAVLLIAAALGPDRLAELFREATEVGLTPLIEVHARRELERVLALGPRVLGINNRNLTTLEVDLDTCLGLRPLIPPPVLVVAESGVTTRADVRRLLAGGLDAFLIGTSLMRSEDPEAVVREFCNGVKP